MLCSGLIKYSTTWSVTSVAAAAANLNVMFLLWLKLSATHILLPQQPNLNVIERKFKRQILKPDPIILGVNSVLNLKVLEGAVNLELALVRASVIVKSSRTFI